MQEPREPAGAVGGGSAVSAADARGGYDELVQTVLQAFREVKPTPREQTGTGFGAGMRRFLGGDHIHGSRVGRGTCPDTI